MHDTKRQARIAGLWYLLLAVTAPVSLVYVPGKLFDTTNAAVTAANIRASSDLLRMGIGFELFHQAIEVFLVLALYALFKPVDKPLARQLALFGLIPIPIMFANAINEVGALLIAANPPYLQTFAQAQQDAAIQFLIRLHSGGIQIAAVFWGLWLIPMARLIFRSRFIPAFIGVPVLGAGLAYLYNAFTTLVVPFDSPTMDTLTVVLQAGELAIVLWLLIVGARSLNTVSASEN